MINPSSATIGAVLGAMALGGCTALEPLASGDDPAGAGSPSEGDGDAGDGDAPREGEGDLTPEEIEEAAADPSICVPGVPGTSQLPRLSRVQFDNTVRDLLYVDVAPSALLAPDSDGSVDQRAWDGYKAAAVAVSETVMADESARSQVITCTPSGDGAECAAQLIRDLGRRAFRRPLTPEETTRFSALIERRAAITPTGSFDELAQLIIEAFLLSPSFIIRGEIAEQPSDQYFALSDYEVASRLSYLLWDSMPDEPLFAAAEAGGLSTPEGIRVQAERLLANPRARAVVRSFHEHFLHMGQGTRWDGINRDPTLFPDFREGMGELFAEETHRFVEHVVFDLGGTYQDLILEPIGFVNADLAPLYGLSAADFGAELVPTPLTEPERAGLFTRLGFLASHSYYDRSSPIHRGAFLQKYALCAPVGTPPPGAEGEPLPTEGLNTNRERVDAQTGTGGCVNCHHTYINPTGFALEAFDAIGAVQVTESFSGAPINTSASVLIGGETVDVTGPAELSQAIAHAPEAHACYARKWVEYAYDRALNNQDACVMEDLTDRLTAGGYTVLQLISDLTQSESFRLRTLETEVGQ
jgi:hypothetical protein